MVEPILAALAASIFSAVMLWRRVKREEMPGWFWRWALIIFMLITIGLVYLYHQQQQEEMHYQAAITNATTQLVNNQLYVHRERISSNGLIWNLECRSYDRNELCNSWDGTVTVPDIEVVYQITITPRGVVSVVELRR